MKKTLIYASIIIVLIIICFGAINTYSNNTSNLENTSNLANNSDLANNSNISNNNSNKDNLSNNTNIETNGHNPKSSTKNFPKNSKLTYLQAFKIASKFAQKSKFTEDPNIKVYIKYNTYYYFGPSNDLFWDFSVYSKKNNECLGAFMVNDASGLPVMI